jgi:hypothetical protein
MAFAKAFGPRKHIRQLSAGGAISDAVDRALPIKRLFIHPPLLLVGPRPDIIQATQRFRSRWEMVRRVTRTSMQLFGAHHWVKQESLSRPDKYAPLPNRVASETDRVSLLSTQLDS